MNTSVTSAPLAVPTAPAQGSAAQGRLAALSQYRPRPRRRFVDLMRAETRKLVDTRSAKALLGVGVLLSLVAVAVSVAFAAWAQRALGAEGAIHLNDLVAGTATVLGLFVGLLGILSVTSEWAQRSTLNTFALEPRRGRVLLAKVIVLALVATLLIAFLIPVAYGTAALGQAAGARVVWSLSWPAIAGLWLSTMINLMMGVGFGLVAMSAPVAIVAYFLVPMLLGLVTSLGGVWAPVGRLIPWIDTSAASAPLLDPSTHMTALGWAHLGVATLIWVGVPFVLGTLRWLHREVR